MSHTVKAKRRSSEKRKEKSRDAARCRRGQEAEIFKDLSHQLPIPYSHLSQLDKASVIRLSIAHIKLRQLFAEVVDGKENPANGIQQKIDQMYFKTLDGFLLLTEKQGEVVYVSENIEKYLGVTQVDVLGQNIFDFIHPCDHEEFRDLLCERNQQQGSVGEDMGRSFVRMKCTLTSKGHNINIKSASYKVIEVSGRTVQLNHSDDVSYTVVIGQPLPDLVHSELCLDQRMFISRLSMNMCFTYCDSQVINLLGFSPDNLSGNSVFKFHHAYDAEVIDKSCKTLFMKGQSKTGLYRFLAKDGGYVWMDTHAAVVGETVCGHQKCILCVNYVISGVEHADQVFSDVQIVESQNIVGLVKCENVIEDDPDEVIVYEEEEDNDDDSSNLVGSKHGGMQFVTEKLLGIKTSPSFNAESVICNATIGIPDMLVTDDLSIDPAVAGIKATKSMPLLDESTLDELEILENRAPYIPMDDMCFGSLSLSTEGSATVGAVTFTAGSLDDDDDVILSLIKTYDHSTNTSESAGSTVIICDAALSSAGVAVKRPVVENEKSQPVNSSAPNCKLMKIDHQTNSAPAKCSTGPTTVNGSSVLMNLLTTGIDTNYGYKLRDVYQPMNSEISSSSDYDSYSSGSCSPVAGRPEGLPTTLLVQLINPTATPLSPELTYLADTGDVVFITTSSS